MANRQFLEQSNSEYKQKIEDELEELKSKAQKVGKQALIVGGSVLLVYSLVSLLSSGSDVKKSENPKQKKAEVNSKPVKKSILNDGPSFLTEVLKEQALVFVLGLAAKKLGDFLKNLDQTKTS